MVDADEVDDSDPSCVHPCFFIAPENNICVWNIASVRGLEYRCDKRDAVGRESEWSS